MRSVLTFLVMMFNPFEREYSVKPSQPLGMCADDGRSLCLKIFYMESDVGHDAAVFLQGVSLRVKASDQNGPLELVLSLDEKNPTCTKRVIREGTVQSTIYNKHIGDLTWSLSPKVRHAF